LGGEGGVSPGTGTAKIPRRGWPAAFARTTMRPVLKWALIAGVLAAALSAPAGAGTIVVKLGLVPGKLSVKAAPAKLAAGATSSIDVKVADGRGTGAGWTLRFANATGLTVTSITARCAAHSTCTLPAAAEDPSGSTVLRTAKDTGMGVIDLVVTVRADSAASVRFAVS